MSVKANDIECLKSLLKETPSSYQEAKIKSSLIDNYLGYDLQEVERKLIKDKNSDQQFWVGLDVQIMQTPYSEILEMLKHANLSSNDVVVDLGAAYGRMGIVIGALYPQIKFTGYEVVKERVDAGNSVYLNWEFMNARLELVDLSEAEHVIPDADLYFIYDFGSKKDVYLVLEKLRVKSQKKSLQVIARGGGVRNWIMQDFPWLSQFKPYDRFDHWTIFRA